MRVFCFLWKIMEDQNVALQVKELTPEELKHYSSLIGGTPRPSVRFGPKGYFFVKEYKNHAAEVYNMELKHGDIFVVSFQRSGTTLTQELVWLIANNLDYDKADTVPLTLRYAFLEQVSFFDEESLKYITEIVSDRKKFEQYMDSIKIPATKLLSDMPSPRFVKTHMPMSLLPPKLLDTAKVVYVARDPRDVAVSYYHQTKLWKYMRLKASFKETWNAFIKDFINYTPFFEHLKEAWALRNHPNMLFIFYEDLLKEQPGSIHRLADFLGKNLTPDQVERLCDHLSIENFRNNKSVNHEELRELNLLDDKETFIRKGKSGGWREYFDEEMKHDAEQWIAENLKDTDLRFPSMENNVY